MFKFKFEHGHATFYSCLGEDLYLVSFLILYFISVHLFLALHPEKKRTMLCQAAFLFSLVVAAVWHWLIVDIYAQVHPSLSLVPLCVKWHYPQKGFQRESYISFSLAQSPLLNVSILIIKFKFGIFVLKWPHGSNMKRLESFSKPSFGLIVRICPVELML